MLKSDERMQKYDRGQCEDELTRKELEREEALAWSSGVNGPWARPFGSHQLGQAQKGHSSQ